MLLGKSAHYRKIFTQSPLQANLALAGLYILLLLPFSMIFSRTLMEVLCITVNLLLIVNSIVYKDWDWLKSTPVRIMIVLWLYGALLVVPLAVNVSAAFEYIYWIRFILLFAAAIYWLADYKEEIYRAAIILFALLVFIACDALVQFMFGISITGHAPTLEGMPLQVQRLTGPFSKPLVGIFLAKMSVGIAGICLFYTAREQKRRLFLALIAGIFLISLVILLSNERTAALSFFIALGLAYVAIFIKFSHMRRIIMLSAAVQALAIMVACYFSNPFHNSLSNSHDTLLNFNNSPYGQLWQAAIIMWREHMVTGVGIHNFRLICPSLIERGLIHYCNLHPHNFYLEWLAEQGILGFWGIIVWLTSIALMIANARFAHVREGYCIKLIAVMAIIVNFFPFVATQSAFSNWPAFLMWQSLIWPFILLRAEQRR